MKKFLSLITAFILIFSLAACGTANGTANTGGTDSGGGNNASDSTGGSTDSSTDSSEQTGSDANPVRLSAARPGAIDFADGNISFIAIDESQGDASKGVEISVEEQFGAKMLKIVNNADGKPYVAIDASSLLGDRISDMRSMECTVATVHPDGNFYAASGTIYGYCGEERTEIKDKKWSVFLEDKNPNLAKFEMSKEKEYMVPDSYNFFVFSIDADNGEGVVLYIGDICFLDASGNVLPVDTSVSFNAPAGFGKMDVSNLIGISGETDINATGSSSGSWGQAVSIDTNRSDTGTFDVNWISPGCVLTVFYTSENAPEVIIQSWTDGAPVSWAKVEPFTVNDSGTIAQFSYEDMIAAFGTDDLAAYFDKFNIGDTGAALEISKVTIGTGIPDSPYVQEDRSNLFNVSGETVLGYTGSSTGSWGQAISVDSLKNEGAFDPAIFVPGSVITIYFVSEIAPEVIMQSWTDGAPVQWGKVAASAVNDSNTIAQYTYDDLVAGFGTDDLETYFDKFNIGDCGAALEVLKVTIGTM